MAIVVERVGARESARDRRAAATCTHLRDGPRPRNRPDTSADASQSPRCQALGEQHECRQRRARQAPRSRRSPPSCTREPYRIAAHRPEPRPHDQRRHRAQQTTTGRACGSRVRATPRTGRTAPPPGTRRRSARPARRPTSPKRCAQRLRRLAAQVARIHLGADDPRDVLDRLRDRRSSPADGARRAAAGTRTRTARAHRAARTPRAAAARASAGAAAPTTAAPGTSGTPSSDGWSARARRRSAAAYSARVSRARPDETRERARCASSKQQALQRIHLGPHRLEPDRVAELRQPRAGQRDRREHCASDRTPKPRAVATQARNTNSAPSAAATRLPERQRGTRASRAAAT